MFDMRLMDRGFEPHAHHCIVSQYFSFFIVHCVPGRTELSGQCVLCDVGTYKEDAGNAACTNCSSIRTTAGKGSISQAECNIGEFYIIKCLKSCISNMVQETLSLFIGIVSHQDFS